jgi:molecular chaperone GrpE (heat shock protein)
MAKLITEHTSPEDCEKEFRRTRNARRQERRDANRAEEREPEPEPSDPIVELAEALAEIVEALEIIGQDMPRVASRLEAAREKINKVRWP